MIDRLKILLFRVFRRSLDFLSSARSGAGVLQGALVEGLRQELTNRYDGLDARVSTLERRISPPIPFELPRERFRGPEEVVTERQREYVSMFSEGEVLDLGCGRGEFLALLREAGIPGRGVDVDAALVRRCRENGLQVDYGDALESLAECAPGSLGGVFSAQLVEHLEMADIARVVALASTRLRRGGVLVLETVNPLCLTGLANFWLDPSHKRPVHPELMRWLAERHGFDEVRILPRLPSDPDGWTPHLELGDSDQDNLEQFNAGIDRVNEILFGAEGYALTARRM